MDYACGKDLKEVALVLAVEKIQKRACELSA
jgi:hypothetical protein